MPIQPASKIVESNSRADFQKAVQPWMVTGWYEHDYGLDAMVEITRPDMGTNGRVATGRRFAVQLRGSDPQNVPEKDLWKTKVKVGQVQYWLASTEPVMLAKVETGSGEVRFMWIDHEQVSAITTNRPDWLEKETLEVDLSNCTVITSSTLDSIREYVNRSRVHARLLVPPGEYFRLHEQATKQLEELANACSSLKLSSVDARIEDLRRTMTSTLYVVAITGATKVGKSTVLNALIRKRVSPIDIIPTTGIPLLVVGGPEEKCVVRYESSAPEEGPATEKFIAQYVSQEHNPKNSKKVASVTVFLRREELYRGVGFLDIPGLNDPNPAIRRLTEGALGMAKAILYLMDGSPMAHGGYPLNREAIEDLQTLSSKADKLFLLINKADAIRDMPQEDKERVDAHIRARLQEYGIAALLPSPPMYVSAKTALGAAGDQESRPGLSGPPGLEELHDVLWTFLLQSNRSGLHRLSDALVGMERGMADVRAMVSGRMLQAEEAAGRMEALSEAEAMLPELLSFIIRGESEVVSSLHELAIQREHAALAYLATHLDKVNDEAGLLSRDELRNYLEQQATEIVMQIHAEATRRLSTIHREVNNRLEAVLAQARLEAPVPSTQYRPDDTHWSMIGLPLPEDYTAPLGGAVGLGLLGALFFGPIGALVGGFIGLIGGLFASRWDRLQRKVDAINRRAREALDRVRQEAFKRSDPVIRQYLQTLAAHTRDRVSVYVSDMRRQVSMAGRPLSTAERKRLEETLRKLDALPNQLRGVRESVQAYL